MFVWQGFLTRGTADIAWTDDDAERHGGQIGAAMRIAEVVGILAEELDAFWQQCPRVCFPGVFDYEVSETLGVGSGTTRQRHRMPCAGRRATWSIASSPTTAASRSDLQ